MSDIKLFRIGEDTAEELESRTASLEKNLQVLFEKNLDVLFEIRFLASEYGTGKAHGGRIDTLGLDENQCPVIIEYKKSVDGNIITQGLYYLDWLLNHQAEFESLVINKLGKEKATGIEWGEPRVLLIASDFNHRDNISAPLIGQNIELIRYRHFGEKHLLLEYVFRKGLKTSQRRDKENSMFQKRLWEALDSYFKKQGVATQMGKRHGAGDWAHIKTTAEDLRTCAGYSIPNKAASITFWFKGEDKQRLFKRAENAPEVFKKLTEQDFSWSGGSAKTFQAIDFEPEGNETLCGWYLKVAEGIQKAHEQLEAEFLQ